MRKMVMANAIREGIRHEMAADSRVFCIGEDITGFRGFGGGFGVTSGLLEEFGEKRVRDTPISEQAIVGLSAGAAATGMRPVVELMFNDFMGCAGDQIMNQAAKFRYMYGGRMQVPMVLRLPTGAGRQAAAQHSQSLEAWLVHIPGLKVVFPSTSADALGLMISSIRDDNPVMFFEHKVMYGMEGEVPDENIPIPLGVADIKRKGGDATIIATGMCVRKSLAAAEELAKVGINIEVIDPRTLFPLDKEMIYKSVAKTGRIVIATEEVKRGAWSAEMASNIAEDMFESLKTKIIRIGELNTPIPCTKVLEDYVVPQQKDIINAIYRVLE